MFDTRNLPEPLVRQAERFVLQWQSSASPEAQHNLDELLSSRAELREQACRAIVGSEFIAGQLLADPDTFIRWLENDELEFLTAWDGSRIKGHLDQSLQRDSDEHFDRSLREFRRKFMVRIVWRDLNRRAGLEETTGELSVFAAAAVQEAMDYHYAALSRRFGLPLGVASESPQPMLVLGMGKLGAGELNVSSDIDLIFAYPETGETAGGRQTLSNQEFFTRLGQRLIKSLDAVTAHGFVFRVDMRLRPYGSSGSLAMSFDGLETYYQTQGREWERYAMIKARVIAATPPALLDTLAAEALPSPVHPPNRDPAAELMSLLQPFTFRRYLDFSAIDAMRAMKQLITREVSRKGLQDDVKLGAGGIREIEFIVQVFQLIRGGRDTRLQERRLLRVLPLLVETACLPPAVADRLAEAYVFLRDTEHALQGWQDRQTQQLPPDGDGQARLAWVMGFDGWDDFAAELQRHRHAVSAQFRELIAEPEEKSGETREDDGWHLIWQNSLIDEAARDFLHTQGVPDPTAILGTLNNLRESRYVLAMQATARDRLDHLMPALLSELGEVENPVPTLERVCGVIEAVARRSAYIVLLLENPSARKQLLKLCSASPWIAGELRSHPVLLDELLDSRTLYTLPDVPTLRDELRRDTLRLSWEDLEGHMEALRYFRMSHALRVAACEVTDLLPLMKVSDYLTFLAEVILEHVLELAWQQMIARYGRPRRADGGTCSVDSQTGDFVIVGYGKLGGIELGHGSDLDLVFVHRADPHLGTEGPREIDNGTFFMRLGQKIIHILNAQTLSGQLYDIDMRLRPSGNSGLLVSTLAAFAHYQEKDAWTWEHQALVRARVVAGGAGLAAEFEEVRQQVLCRERDLPELRREVVDMREKMRRHLGSESQPRHQEPRFHIKQDAGGIVDIEFMVQYAVLAWAHLHPALTRYTDNIRILGCLAEAGLVTPDEADQLIEAYKTYRSTVHRLALQGLPSIVSGDRFLPERSLVVRHWQRLLIAHP
ncbi:bifunctional [glutamate--ammonia ligase]-adenylyl-L-tyrosine phosphorylase/[glutamate--ammonia-ligase] adenylyltransferase [Gilvimarinus sp. F26214L]|uniref:bifunctional [glutamate--ammonia ligase]-adenylyl-L-tyrosine phosphorylase/[glutamate--ammonia-ligase] adenylyltransferase n=1 Tax=Gilvimarinus sp. DZF01 TaxID=3461371 RepID=UPI0040466CC3